MPGGRLTVIVERAGLSFRTAYGGFAQSLIKSLRRGKEMRQRNTNFWLSWAFLFIL